MIGDSGQVIDGLRVPDALLQAIAEDRWKPPDDPGKMEEVFPEPPGRPIFLRWNGMIRENEAWHAEEEPHVREWYLGLASKERPPGDIDPIRSLLIGFLGPDQHIALDYRAPMEQPSVVYLTANEGWVEVAPNIETLLELLGLNS